MTCRQCRGIEQFFDEDEANSELKKYRKKGPAKTTQMLIDAIIAEGVDGRSLMDIGGGVGAVQHELLKAGAKSVVGVDASSAYVKVAEEEAERQGHEDRVSYHLGDFIDIVPNLEQVDVVTLDRVVCCYHDVEKLVTLSAERAAKLYALVYPRDNWVSRSIVRLINLTFRLRRHPFRLYIHPTKTVDELLRRNGLKQRFLGKTLVWQVVVYGR